MMDEIGRWPLTGRKRLTARRWGDGIILVLQVEQRSPRTPVTHWRDATVADLTEGSVGLDALKVVAC